MTYLPKMIPADQGQHRRPGCRPPDICGAEGYSFTESVLRIPAQLGRQCHQDVYGSMDEPSNYIPTERHGARSDCTGNLDILRSTAVLLVLTAHTFSTIADRHHLQGWDDYVVCGGRIGVLLFFVHTSLVLNFSLARLATSISGWALFRTFMVRRIFRLYPLSILCVLLVVVFSIPVVSSAQTSLRPGWGTILSNITLTTDLFNYPVVLAPMWTLPIEMQMYVAMPFVFMLLGAGRDLRIALGLWLLAVIVGWMQTPLARWLSVLDCGPCFIAGTVAFTLSGRYTQTLASFLWVPFLCAMMYVFFIVQHGAPEGVGNAPLQWAFCLIVGFAIPAFRDSRLAPANDVASRIARYSYGIYLFHPIALWVGCRVLGDEPELLQWIVVVGVLSVLSIGSYHLLEKPAIDFGMRLTAGMPRHIPLLGSRSLS
jgi:peptidoglycan/LPS O-acetylase OafA/YrhL